MTLTPTTAQFDHDSDGKDFAVPNNSTAAVSILAALISDPSAGFAVVTADQPTGRWDGTAHILVPGQELVLHVEWNDPRTKPAPSSYSAALTVAHSGRGAPTGQLTATPPTPTPPRTPPPAHTDG